MKLTSESTIKFCKNFDALLYANFLREVAAMKTLRTTPLYILTFNTQNELQFTLESVIDIGQGISVGPRRFGKNNKRRALNKRRTWKIWKKNNRRAGKI